MLNYRLTLVLLLYRDPNALLDFQGILTKLGMQKLLIIKIELEIIKTYNLSCCLDWPLDEYHVSCILLMVQLIKLL